MVNSATIGADILRQRAERAELTRSGAADTAYLILDCESVPDGKLVSEVKYHGQNLSPEEAIRRAQDEAAAQSPDGSRFLPVTFQIPIAVCVMRVAADYTPQAITCLDTPDFRPEEIVRKFWLGCARYRAKMVTFNGRGFDLPLLELAAFRWGFSAREHFQSSRNRFNGNHFDLLDWMSNFRAYRLAGGLNLLAKILGKPGKMDVDGDKVYEMHRAGLAREINDYCMFDTLDTYFVFLRSRVLTGDLTLDQERALEEDAREWLIGKAVDMPVLHKYLNAWQSRETPPVAVAEHAPVTPPHEAATPQSP
jgi:predicted PolB exonuclease-like 3'-5' exonuclease